MQVKTTPIRLHGQPRLSIKPLPSGFLGWSPSLASKIRNPRSSSWVRSYANDDTIPPLVKRVLCAIAQYANRSGRCFPSLRTIGDKVGLTVKPCPSISPRRRKYRVGQNHLGQSIARPGTSNSQHVPAYPQPNQAGFGGRET